jgi:hypothetical protein
VVGVYDVAVLAASDAGALSEWLNKNGYAFPEKRTDVLEHYTAKKWVYVAMRVDRKALAGDEVEKLKVGELQPIRFAFDSGEMVYPLKISSINAGYTEILLYCLADVPMVVYYAPTPNEFSMEANLPNFMVCRTPEYGDPDFGTYRKARGDELPLTWAALGSAKDIELFLCKYRQTCRSEQMFDDMHFQPIEPQAYWRVRLGNAESNRLQALNVLASHDPDLLERLATSPDRNSRLIAARHPKTPERLLLALAEDEDRSLRWCVANNPNASLDVLHKLANDADSGVRYGVAIHPRTPVELLETLANDSSAQVRRGLVDRLNVTVGLLRKLAQDEDQYVRIGVASRDETPMDVLKKLADDADAEVAGCAKLTLQRRAGGGKPSEDEKLNNRATSKNAKRGSR